MLPLYFNRSYPYLRPATVYMPLLPVRIYHGASYVDILALVDSGAEIAVCDDSVAVALGLNTAMLPQRSFQGLGGAPSLPVAQLDIEAERRLFAIEIAFAPLGTSFALVGRTGVFDRIRFGFDHGLVPPNLLVD